MTSTDSIPSDMNRELTTGFAATVIGKKARQLARQGNFTRSDIPDLEQEMKLRLWKRLARFNPDKAPWPVFVVTIVERHAATIIQMDQRQKRNDEVSVRLLSEKVPLSDEESTWLAHTLTNEDQEALRGRYVENEHTLVELRLDLEACIARLPKNLQMLCRLLMTGSLTRAAKQLNISRPKASQMLAQIRTHNDFKKNFAKTAKSPDATRANAVVKE